MAGSRLQSNFTHLKVHDEQLVRLGLLAERYFAEDPNTCLIKLRQLGLRGECRRSSCRRPAENSLRGGTCRAAT